MFSVWFCVTWSRSTWCDYILGLDQNGCALAWFEVFWCDLHFWRWLMSSRHYKNVSLLGPSGLGVVKCSSKWTAKMFCRTSDWIAPALQPPDIEFKSYNGQNNLLNKYLSRVKLSVCKKICVLWKHFTRLPARPPPRWWCIYFNISPDHVKINYS